MQNKAYVYTEDNQQIVIEIILSFKVEETGKSYVAYTLNDDDVSDTVPVFISEYDGKGIKDIPNEDTKIVLDAYNAAKELIDAE